MVTLFTVLELGEDADIDGYQLCSFVCFDYSSHVFMMRSMLVEREVTEKGQG